MSHKTCTKVVAKREKNTKKTSVEYCKYILSTNIEYASTGIITLLLLHAIYVKYIYKYIGTHQHSTKSIVLISKDTSRFGYWRQFY